MLHLNKPEKVIKKVQVYMKEGIQKVAYPLRCRNIRGKMYISVSVKSITQKTKSTKTKTAVDICKIYTHKIKIRQPSHSPQVCIYLRHTYKTR